MTGTAPLRADGGLDCEADLTRFVTPMYSTSFEPDDGAWVEAVPPSGGTATVDIVDGGLDGGGKAIRLTPMTGTGIFAVAKKRNDPAPNLQLAPGAQYCMQGWVRADTNVSPGQIFYLIVRQYDSGGTQRGATITSPNLTASTLWQRAWTHVGVAAGTTSTDYFDVRFRSDVGVQTFRVDDIALFRLPEP